MSSRKLRVLLVEDDAQYAQMISLLLGQAAGEEVELSAEFAPTLGEARSKLSMKGFDAVLLDLNLPDSRGLETVSAICAAAPLVPVVVLTGVDDEDLALEAVRLGAQDYLVKFHFKAQLLRRSLFYAIERGRLAQGLQNILRNSADAMLVVDREGLVRYVNPAAEVLFGRAAVELLDKPFGFPLSPGATSELALPEDESGSRLAQMRVTELEWRQGTAFLAVVRDITHLQRLEKIRAEIRERKRTDRIKDDFLGSVSHELRSPLNIIKGAAANLRDGFAGDLPPSQLKLMGMLGENVDRMTRIVSNLLDFSRLEHGGAKPRPMKVDLRRLLAHTLAGFALTDRGKKLELVSDLAADLPMAHADPDMAAQILVNLIDNALRFASSKVKIAAGADASDPGRIRVQVADDGPGIPADKRGQLFQRFKQLQREGEGYKGTGLGLALCREMIELHEGKIWAESSPGGGACICFTLPRFEKARAPGLE